jgi:hypothetical protein
MARKSYRQPTSSEDIDVTAILDRRVAEMRRMVAAMEPGSAASALRVLRDAFPEAPLAERVRALIAGRH